MVEAAAHVGDLGLDRLELCAALARHGLQLLVDEAHEVADVGPGEDVGAKLAAVAQGVAQGVAGRLPAGGGRACADHSAGHSVASSCLFPVAVGFGVDDDRGTVGIEQYTTSCSTRPGTASVSSMALADLASDVAYMNRISPASRETRPDG